MAVAERHSNGHFRDRPVVAQLKCRMLNLWMPPLNVGPLFTPGTLHG
jgi:hypothetical protein